MLLLYIKGKTKVLEKGNIKMLVLTNTFLIWYNIPKRRDKPMRRDIMEVLRRMKKEEIKPNYAELAREFNCDYRVIKRYWEEEITEKKRKAKV